MSETNTKFSNEQEIKQIQDMKSKLDLLHLYYNNRVEKLKLKYTKLPASALMTLAQEKTRWHMKRINNLQTNYQIAL